MEKGKRGEIHLNLPNFAFMNGNVGFELHRLQKLFATSITAVKAPGCFFDPGLIHGLVVGEVARIKHCLVEKVLIIEGEDAVRRYVRIHQYSIVAIMDKLFHRRDQPGVLECIDILDGLLSFLAQHFAPYFDDLGKAPLKHIHDMRIEIAASFELLQKRLLSACCFEQFAYMILDPLVRLYSKHDGQRVSFHRLRFLGYILQHSRNLAEEKPESDDVDQHFVDLMLYLNFNSRKTYRQLIQFLRDFLPADLDYKSKRSTLCHFLKTATLASVKANTGYHPHGPTLKSQLMDYLHAELRQLSDEHEAEQRQEQNPPEPIANRAKFDLSVAQLGCVLRLLTDTGVLTTENISALIRCVAVNCETKKSRSISPESLRLKFYDIEEGTRRAVQEKLANLIKSAENLLK